MRSRVLVTGKNGQIGQEITSLVPTLGGLNNYDFVFVAREDADLLDVNQVFKLISDLAPQYIIHTAAKVGGINYNIESSYKMLYENLILDSNVIRCALDLKVSNFIYFSSSCMYPINAKQPFTIDSIFKGPFELTNESYAIAKSTITKLLQGIDLQNEVNFKVFVLSNLYGKYDNFNEVKSHAVAAAFNKVLKAKMSDSRQVEIWGTGNPRREFTLAKDVARFVLNSLPILKSLPSSMNLGCGFDYSINEIYQIISEVLDYEVSFYYNNLMPDGVSSKLMDSSVAMKNFNWRPEKDLRNGLISEMIPALSGDMK